MAPLPPLAEAHHADLTVVTGAATGDLLQAWPASTGDPVDTLEWLMQTLPGVVDTYGSAAASLGSNFYEESRDAANVPGHFSAIAADLPGTAQTDSLARWSMAGLFRTDANQTVDLTVAQTKLEGGLQRTIANVDRQTVIGSAKADPKARGWRRYTTGGCCDFCTMLADKGAIYYEDNADFAAHDHCHCWAGPAFEGDGGGQQPAKPYAPSSRTASAADRARLRAYLKANYPTAS